MGEIMLDRRQFVGLTAASALAPALLPRAAVAQAWPSRFVRLVVPYASGGPTDAVARVVADPLARAWGQQVVIENKGGAGTNIGAEAVARSDPDGYTLLVGSSALAMNRALYRTLSYDAIADFVPVTLIVSFSFFMCVPNSSPAKSVKEFIAYAKDKGGKLTYATPGVEAGVPGFEVSSFYGLFLPIRTPADIVRKINADTVTALADPPIKGRLEQLGYAVIGSTAEDLAAHLQSEIDKWGPVIKGAGIRIDS